MSVFDWLVPYETQLRAMDVAVNQLEHEGIEPGSALDPKSPLNRRAGELVWKQGKLGDPQGRANPVTTQLESPEAKIQAAQEVQRQAPPSTNDRLKALGFEQMAQRPSTQAPPTPQASLAGQQPQAAAPMAPMGPQNLMQAILQGFGSNAAQNIHQANAMQHIARIRQAQADVYQIELGQKIRVARAQQALPMLEAKSQDFSKKFLNPIVKKYAEEAKKNNQRYVPGYREFSEAVQQWNQAFPNNQFDQPQIDAWLLTDRGRIMFPDIYSPQDANTIKMDYEKNVINSVEAAKQKAMIGVPQSVKELQNMMALQQQMLGGGQGPPYGLPPPVASQLPQNPAVSLNPSIPAGTPGMSTAGPADEVLTPDVMAPPGGQRLPSATPPPIQDRPLSDAERSMVPQLLEQARKQHQFNQAQGMLGLSPSLPSGLPSPMSIPAPGTSMQAEIAPGVNMTVNKHNQAIQGYVNSAKTQGISEVDALSTLADHGVDVSGQQEVLFNQIFRDREARAVLKKQGMGNDEIDREMARMAFDTTGFFPKNQRMQSLVAPTAEERQQIARGKAVSKITNAISSAQEAIKNGQTPTPLNIPHLLQQLENEGFPLSDPTVLNDILEPHFKSTFREQINMVKQLEPSHPFPERVAYNRTVEAFNGLGIPKTLQGLYGTPLTKEEAQKVKEGQSLMEARRDTLSSSIAQAHREAATVKGEVEAIVQEMKADAKIVSEARRMKPKIESGIALGVNLAHSLNNNGLFSFETQERYDVFTDYWRGLQSPLTKASGEVGNLTQSERELATAPWPSFSDMLKDYAFHTDRANKKLAVMEKIFRETMKDESLTFPRFPLGQQPGASPTPSGMTKSDQADYDAAVKQLEQFRKKQGK